MVLLIAWKFNSSLLEDASYIQLISSNYPEWLEEFKDVNGKRVLWDLIKYKIRQASIKYSKQKARERRARLATAEQKVKQCDLSCNSDPWGKKNCMTLMLRNMNMNYYSTINIVGGNIVRSRINRRWKRWKKCKIVP